jgi:hypothetical protein
MADPYAQAFLVAIARGREGTVKPAEYFVLTLIPFLLAAAANLPRGVGSVAPSPHLPVSPSASLSITAHYSTTHGTD